MKNRLLGKTGLRVSEINLGTMTFGEEWGWGANKEVSTQIWDAYVNKGGNFIDTANRYTEGTSEKYVGEFMKAERDHFVVATKYTLFDKIGDPNYSGNHRKNMMRSVEGSLKRLDTDYIDILYLHAWDFLTPIEEVLRGLDDLVKAGKILHAGISDTPAWIVSQANTIADLRGWTRFNVLQIEYSLLQRTVERDLIPMADAFDIAVAAWAPLAGGALTGKYLKENDDPKRLAEKSARLSEKSVEITKKVVEIAEKIGQTPAQVATRWTMQSNPTVIPIVGARTLAQIEDSLGALDFELTNDQTNELNEVSKIDVGFPHDFLSQETIRNIIFGETQNSIIK